MHKHMLRTLGLSLIAALGLMGLTAGGAQAEALKGVAGKIKVLGVDAAAGTTITGEQEGQGTLLIPGLNAEIVCQKVDVLVGKILSGANGEALAELLYLECVLWGTKKNAVTGEQELTTKLPCEILEHKSPFAAGSIVAAVKLLVVLHEVSAGVSDTYILATADNEKEEGTIASVLVTTPSECPLPKLTEIRGSFVFKVTLGDLNLKQPEELYVLATASRALSSSGLFTDKLLYGGINEAFLDASLLLWLVSDCKWGLI